MLKNRYYVMRHGESSANASGIIASDPLTAKRKFGLTKQGKRQVLNTVTASFKSYAFDRIYTSDFLRARETAEIAAECFGIRSVIYTSLLRERFFGTLDGEKDSEYQKAWELDESGMGLDCYGIETPDEVLDRLLSLIRECEKKHTGETILLVSHGDPLQIILAAFEGIGPRNHRSVAHLNIGEIRELVPHENFTLEEDI